MCGRFTLKTPASELASLFDGLSFSDIPPRFNICPTQMVACLRWADGSTYQLSSLRWGLVPFWAKDLKIGARMINARSETAATKPAFRAAFKKRRCLIVADGFYEWKKEGKQKQPYYITQADESPFVLAGLWESWTDKASQAVVETCTILTTEANGTMQPLHDRMPVFLDSPQHDAWLDPAFQDTVQLQSWLVPCADDRLKTRRVDTWVNKAGNEGPECLAPPQEA